LQFCGWKQYPGDNFDWRLGQSATSSINTGPSNDHTLGDKRGKCWNTIVEKEVLYLTCLLEIKKKKNHQPPLKYWLYGIVNKAMHAKLFKAMELYYCLEWHYIIFQSFSSCLYYDLFQCKNFNQFLGVTFFKQSCSRKCEIWWTGESIDLTVCLQSIEMRTVIVVGSRVVHRQPKSLLTSRKSKLWILSSCGLFFWHTVNMAFFWKRWQIELQACESC